MEPGNLNVLVGTSTYDARVFGLVYGPGLITVEPYENEDFPWEATRWEVGTWTTPQGNEASKITYYLRDDVTWHDGVPFTAEDVKFTMDYLKQQRVPKYQTAWIDDSHSEIDDDYTITVYFNNAELLAHVQRVRIFGQAHLEKRAGLRRVRAVEGAPSDRRRLDHDDRHRSVRLQGIRAGRIRACRPLRRLLGGSGPIS